jgi:L-asparaginase
MSEIVQKTRVLILYTGGTIGMVPRDPSNPASPLHPGEKEEILTYVPRLGEKEGIYWEILGLPGYEPLDSSDVKSEHWLKMAETIEDQYSNWDGFVILHGTDTMAYTASALSFLLQNLAKPVVITGSQLPLSSTRTDARLNLANSLFVAGYKATGLPLVPEVVLCFGSKLLRGNRARKFTTSDLDGFESPNFPPLGHLGEHIQIHSNLIRKAADNEKSPFYAHKGLSMNVMDVGLFPGMQAGPLSSVLLNSEVAGVVVRTFGAGNAMSDTYILNAFKAAIAKDKIILNITQCFKGMVEMGLYEASSALLEMGVISGLDLTPEAALTKMFWILETESGPEVQTQLQISQRGEQSEDLFDVRYGELGSSLDPAKIKASYKPGARPAGQFRKERLKRAILRLSGVKFVAKTDCDFELRVFMNHQAGPETPVTDPRCACVFSGKMSAYDESKPGQTLLADITAKVHQFAESGRAINLTVVSPTGGNFICSGVFLALFAESSDGGQ